MLQQISTLNDIHLKVEDLGWDSTAQTVLDGVTFAAHRGEFLGLLGPNGAGKSTLLRCLYRYFSATRGEIVLNGRNINELSRQQFSQQVAVVLQHAPGPFPLSVGQFVATGLLARQPWWQRRDKVDEQRQIDATLDRIQLLPLKSRLYSELSGGEQQRTLIARALLQQPKLLLLDEPTNHLDIRYQSEILTLIRNLGITIIASIHDLNLASAFCDRLLLLHKGRLRADGPPKQVLTTEMIATVWDMNANTDANPFGDHPRITYQYQTKGKPDASD